jgi:uncharacterized protein (TIGR00255 family)
MTGFGTAEFTDTRSHRYTIELKSLNQRFLDIQVKLPRELSSIEWFIRKQVSQMLGRGKVDITITKAALVQREQNELNTSLLNRDLLFRYLESYRTATNEAIAQGYAISPSELSFLLSQPGVLARDTEQFEVHDQSKELCCASFRVALDELLRSRAEEGEQLHQALESLRVAMEQNLQTVQARHQQTKPDTLSALTAKVQHVLGDQRTLDESRLVQEVFYLCERADITEEITRLSTHIQQLGKKLSQGGRIGRELDFLCQELGREWNTIGSKCTDIEIVAAVLEAKSTLEKIREQVQNIE